MNKSTKLLIWLCTIGLVMGIALGEGISIWSQPSGPTTVNPPVVMPSSLSPVAWFDLNSSTTTPNPANINANDTLKLSTAISPTTTHTQTVTFYFTQVVNPTKSTPIGTNSTTQLVVAGTGTGTSSVNCNWKVPDNGTYYFIAEIVTPT